MKCACSSDKICFVSDSICKELDSSKCVTFEHFSNLKNKTERLAEDIENQIGIDFIDRGPFFTGSHPSKNYGRAEEIILIDLIPKIYLDNLEIIYEKLYLQSNHLKEFLWRYLPEEGMRLNVDKFASLKMAEKIQNLGDRLLDLRSILEKISEKHRLKNAKSDILVVPAETFNPLGDDPTRDWIKSMFWIENYPTLSDIHITTKSNSSVFSTFSCEYEGKYSLWLRLFAKNERGGLKIKIDNTVHKRIKLDKKSGWMNINIGSISLDRGGEYRVDIENDGTGYNDVDCIILVNNNLPKTNYFKVI